MGDYLNKITVGDCREVLPHMETASVDMAVMAPPTWGSKDGWDVPRLDDYAKIIVPTFLEVYRVLKPAGTCWYITNDRYKDGPIVGAPWNIVGRLLNLGWKCMSDVIYSKATNWVIDKRPRPTNTHDYCFMLVKSEDYYFRVLEHLNRTILHVSEERPYEGYKWLQTPTQLLEVLMRMSTKPGEVVLDPFIGSGTTAVVAEKLGRQWMGIEIDESAVALAKERMAKEAAKCPQ